MFLAHFGSLVHGKVELSRRGAEAQTLWKHQGGTKAECFRLLNQLQKEENAQVEIGWYVICKVSSTLDVPIPGIQDEHRAWRTSQIAPECPILTSSLYSVPCRFGPGEEGEVWTRSGRHHRQVLCESRAVRPQHRRNLVHRKTLRIRAEEKQSSSQSNQRCHNQVRQHAVGRNAVGSN